MTTRRDELAEKIAGFVDCAANHPAAVAIAAFIREREAALVKQVERLRAVLARLIALDERYVHWLPINSDAWAETIDEARRAVEDLERSRKVEEKS